MQVQRWSDLKAAILLAVAGALFGCSGDSHLRGFVTESPDGKTYLAIADDHNGCPISVDGQKWTAPTGEAREIAPGEHLIECYGGEIRFVIPEGVVFNFDYWGP